MRRAIHRSDLHGALLRAKLSQDQPGSSYVAYRGAVPIAEVSSLGISMEDVVVYIGERCHFVQYPLRGGEMFNQVAVFESPKARAGEAEWGTPDELDAAFVRTCAQVRAGLGYLWRDRWWRMFDREPIDSWVLGRLALTGDAAHPPLQYLAQGAVMAIEDAWTMAEHVTAHRGAQGVDWPEALAAYEAVRRLHTARVLRTARSWGDLWRLEAPARDVRNAYLRGRDAHADLAPPFPPERPF